MIFIGYDRASVPRAATPSRNQKIRADFRFEQLWFVWMTKTQVAHINGMPRFFKENLFTKLFTLSPNHNMWCLVPGNLYLSDVRR